MLRPSPCVLVVPRAPTPRTLVLPSALAVHWESIHRRTELYRAARASLEHTHRQPDLLPVRRARLGPTPLLMALRLSMNASLVPLASTRTFWVLLRPPPAYPAVRGHVLLPMAPRRAPTVL